MATLKIEAETIMNFNEEERVAYIYTHNRRLINRLKALCGKFPNEFKHTGTEGEAENFVIPKRYLSIRGPKESRIYSEEEKAKLRERMLNVKAKMK